MTQEVFNKVATEMLIEDAAKAKFSFKKVNGFYYIIDTETGNRCITEEGKTKPFRTRTVTKLSKELYKLRTAYKKHLELQELSKLDQEMGRYEEV